MKKQLILLGFLLVVIPTFYIKTEAQFTLGKIQGYAERGGGTIRTSAVTTHTVQSSYPNSTITVYQTGTLTLASIFSDTVGASPKSNPFTADSVAFYSFFVADGCYDIKFSGTGIATPFTISRICTDTQTVQMLAAATPTPSPTPNPLSTKTVYVRSNGAVLNSNITTGGGTNDTAAIQAAFDLASSGTRITVVVDGVALVNQIKIRSNTSLICTGAGGFYLAPNTNKALLINANQTTGTVVDKNITIEGCSFNGNYANQVGIGLYNRREVNGTLIGLIQLYGIDNLYTRNLTLLNSKTIAFHLSKASNVRISHTYIDNNVPTEPQQGGIQVEGSSSNIIIEDVIGNTQDDLTALSSYGSSYVEGIFTGLGPNVTNGPITDVQIKGLIGYGGPYYSYSAVRLFNSINRIDRVTVDGITGKFATVLFWNDPAGLPTGNIGTVSISHVNVQMKNYTTVTPFQSGFAIYNSFDHLILNDITFNDPEDNRGHLYFSPTADVKHLEVNGLRVYDTVDRTSQVMIYLDGGARIRQADLYNITWLRGSAHVRAESLLHITTTARIDNLFINRLYANRVDTIVFKDTNTTTVTMTLRNIQHLDTTSSANRTVSNLAGIISLLDISSWYSDVAGRVFNSGTITAKRGDAFITNGSCVLVAGVCTIAYTDATATTQVFRDRRIDSGTLGVGYSVVRNVGVSIVITSKDAAGATQAGDTSTLDYQIRDN
jgi:hypothetical protein